MNKPRTRQEWGLNDSNQSEEAAKALTYALGDALATIDRTDIKAMPEIQRTMLVGTLMQDHLNPVRLKYINTGTATSKNAEVAIKYLTDAIEHKFKLDPHSEKKTIMTETKNAILTNGNSYLLTGWTTAADIPPGFYGYDIGMMGVQFMKKEMSHERIQKVSKSQSRLFQIIRDFWTKKPRYEKMQVRHRLAMMMYGIPGTGKTVAMRKAIQDTIDVGGYALDMDDLNEFIGAVKAIRKIHPNVPILGACEDMDSRFDLSDNPRDNRHQEERWTHLLDGVGNELDGVLIVATTNNIKAFSDRLLRPGRFDVKVEIDPPTFDERIEFIAELWDVPKDHGEVIEIAETTDKMVIAEIKSIAVRRYIDGIEDYEPSKATRLRKLKEAEEKQAAEVSKAKVVEATVVGVDTAADDHEETETEDDTDEETEEAEAAR